MKQAFDAVRRPGPAGEATDRRDLAAAAAAGLAYKRFSVDHGVKIIR
jgi:hypothetical protein